MEPFLQPLIGESEEKMQKAVALALLSLKEKGKSRSSDVMSYGKGGRGVLGRVQVSWKKLADT